MNRIASFVFALALAGCATATTQTASIAPLPAPRAAPSAAALAAAPLLQPTQLPWVERPSIRDYMAVYPTTALQGGLNGSATLECLVERDYRVACAVRSETPANHGFGDAALRVSPRLLVARTLPDGQQTQGGKLLWQVDFNSTGRIAVTGNLTPRGGRDN